MWLWFIRQYGHRTWSRSPYSQLHPMVNNFLLPLWGLWCRGLRFFIVRLSVCLFCVVCCLSRSDLIQNWTCKSASSEGTMEKFDQKTVPILDQVQNRTRKSASSEGTMDLIKKRFPFSDTSWRIHQWRRLRHSRCCWWVITHFESRLHHRTQRGHPCPAGVIYIYNFLWPLKI